MYAPPIGSSTSFQFSATPLPAVSAAIAGAQAAAAIAISPAASAKSLSSRYVRPPQPTNAAFEELIKTYPLTNIFLTMVSPWVARFLAAKNDYAAGINKVNPEQYIQAIRFTLFAAICNIYKACIEETKKSESDLLDALIFLIKKISESFPKDFSEENKKDLHLAFDSILKLAFPEGIESLNEVLGWASAEYGKTSKLGSTVTGWLGTTGYAKGQVWDALKTQLCPAIFDLLVPKRKEVLSAEAELLNGTAGSGLKGLAGLLSRKITLYVQQQFATEEDKAEEEGKKIQERWAELVCRSTLNNFIPPNTEKGKKDEGVAFSPEQEKLHRAMSLGIRQFCQLTHVPGSEASKLCQSVFQLFERRVYGLLISGTKYLWHYEANQASFGTTNGKESYEDTAYKALDGKDKAEKDKHADSAAEVIRKLEDGFRPDPLWPVMARLKKIFLVIYENREQIKKWSAEEKSAEGIQFFHTIIARVLNETNWVEDPIFKMESLKSNLPSLLFRLWRRQYTESVALPYFLDRNQPQKEKEVKVGKYGNEGVIRPVGHHIATIVTHVSQRCLSFLIESVKKCEPLLRKKAFLKMAESIGGLKDNAFFQRIDAKVREALPVWLYDRIYHTKSDAKNLAEEVIKKLEREDKRFYDEQVKNVEFYRRIVSDIESIIQVKRRVLDNLSEKHVGEAKENDLIWQFSWDYLVGLFFQWLKVNGISMEEDGAPGGAGPALDPVIELVSKAAKQVEDYLIQPGIAAAIQKVTGLLTKLELEQKEKAGRVVADAADKYFEEKAGLERRQLEEVRQQAIQDLANIFIPLTEALIKELRLDRVPMLAILGDDALKSQLASVGAMLYLTLSEPQRHYPEGITLLCRLFFDHDHFTQQPDLLREGELTAKKEGLSAEEAQWKVSGVRLMAERVYDILEAELMPYASDFMRFFLGHVSQHDHPAKQKAAEETGRKNREFLANLTNDKMGLGLDVTGVRWLGELIASLTEKREDGRQSLWRYVESYLALQMPKLLYNMVSTVQKRKKERAALAPVPVHPVAAVAPARVTHRLESVFEDTLFEIVSLFYERLNGQGLVEKELASPRGISLGEEKRADGLKTIFRPLAVDLLELFCSADSASPTHPLRPLPFMTAELNKKFWDNIKESCAGLAVKWYDDVIGCQVMKDIPGDMIDKVATQKNLKVDDLSWLLGHWTANYMPEFLKNKHHDWAQVTFKLFMDSVSRLPGPSKTTIENYLKDRAGPIVHLAGNSLNRLGQEERKAMVAAWSVIGVHMVTPIAKKALGGITNAMGDIDRKNPEVRLQIVKTFIVYFTNHVKSNFGKKDGHGKLDEGVVKRIPDSLIKLSGLKPEDLPFPGPSKELMFNLLARKTFPILMSNIWSSVLSRNTMNLMKVNLIDQLAPIFSTLPPVFRKESKDGVEAGAEVKVKEDQKDKSDAELDKFYADLLKELLPHLPWLTKNAIEPSWLFFPIWLSNGKIREMEGKALGRATLKTIDNFPGLIFCGNIFRSTIPCLHPVKWTPPLNNFVLQRWTPKKDGFELTDLAPGTEVDFPIFKADLMQKRFQKMNADRTVQNEKTAFEKLEGIVNLALRTTLIDHSMDEAWKKIDGWIRRLTQFILRDFHHPIYRLLTEILMFIGKAIGFILYPITRAISLIGEGIIGPSELKKLDTIFSDPSNEQWAMHGISDALHLLQQAHEKIAGGGMDGEHDAKHERA